MSKDNSIRYLEELSNELASTLGSAIWSFSKIEWVSYEYLKKLSRDDILALVGDQSFNKRMDILRKIVKKMIPI